MPCTTILAGKNATNDGSTIIARNDDGGFDTKKIIVVRPEEQPKVYKSVIGHLEIELPEDPLRVTFAPNVNRKEGIWAACGMNSANVGMTATETVTSNSRVLGADPLVEYQEKTEEKEEIPGGIGEEDLTAIVLPFIKSAREGVLRLGALLEKYGTYEMNGIAFNDENDIWWMETIGGHHWIAKRVPDDRVVIMPNQFGLDEFDFEDAYGEKRENLCSSDLKEFTQKNHLDLSPDGNFNPRLAFGSRSDHDHIYNTPRAWYMARYFLPRTYHWDGPSADFTPESNDIPWSFVPEHRVTVEEIRYLLGSHYQGTPYDPYEKREAFSGKYRSIGVPNSDLCGMIQIRGYMPEYAKGLEWFSMGGSGFTAFFPFYGNVSSLPDYISGTPERVSTEHMYWHSRLIAALTDTHYGTGELLDARYLEAVRNKAMAILSEYDGRILTNKAPENEAEPQEGLSEAGEQLLSEANEKILRMVKEESDKALEKLLKNAGEHAKNRYHRNDN